MSSFQVHTTLSAPEGSRQALQSLAANVGFVPNLAAAMAESPELLNGFLAVRRIYQQGTFTPGEIEVLSLTSAFENGCAWCMAFHTTMAQKEGVSAKSIAALRAGQAPVEPRLRALSDFARAMVRKRGTVTADDLQSFQDAGFTHAQAMEVVLGMAFSLMANYAGHLADAPVNEQFRANVWESPSLAAGRA